MTRKFYLSLLSFFLFCSIWLKAQPTILAPGDIAVVAVATNTDLCGFGLESDQISFVCFKDIRAFTRIQITDNGWEKSNLGQWGNTEGTIEFLRAGGTITAGTVITFNIQCNGSGCIYTVVSPDANWIITDLNPAGDFNLETGGDQFYFLQNGTWNAGTAGLDNATYGGDVLYGFTTLGAWAADGTTHQSNLHPDVAPCFYMSSAGSEFFKYTNNFTPTNQFDWWHRFQDGAQWTSYSDCLAFEAANPNYPGGFSIGIQPVQLGLMCSGCFGCPTYDAFFLLQLPPGYTFDIEYTDGNDTYTINDAVNGQQVWVSISDTTTYELVSVTEVGGCPVNFPFTSEATFNAPHNNPGTHGVLWICPDYGVINLGIFLGPHDPGGQWFPPLDPFLNMFYLSDWGPGT